MTKFDERTEARIRSFVGPNADYYLGKWAAFWQNPGSMVGFNFAAFLLTVFWLAYRKLYLAAFLVTLVLIGEVAIFLYFDDRGLITDDSLLIWNLILSLSVPIVVGLLGNYWYWKKYFRSAGSDDELRRRGGTSAVAAAIVFFLYIAPSVWVLYWASPILFAGPDSPYANYMFDQTGPLTLAEVRANLLDHMDSDVLENREACVFSEVTERAAAAGDPETLDPESIELLPEKHWPSLDADGKRLILMQAIVNKAFLEC